MSVNAVSFIPLMGKRRGSEKRRKYGKEESAGLWKWGGAQAGIS